ncbi:MAG: hypothetical protein BLM47_02075 [Candidatus Reconcilbacillus cellulovorans]|mgnify:FL=1|uniref:Heparinase II N-terminal domain-containing protein n=1 Tax=Candidatus Reconcilbacillus cellulovorans TaxID=1906605 RepID=A0A2A6E388_9BACL|nr:MAG: hypothetical protein BLM47_02075 [Candidatus Reconcilbacillus cellulovorans]
MAAAGFERGGIEMVSERSVRSPVTPSFRGGDPLRPYEREEWEAYWRRVREDDAYAALRKEIREEAEHHDAESVPALTWELFRRWTVDGDRQTYETAYFRRRKRLTAHALRLLVWPEEARFRDALCETIWAVCDEFSWCLPAHFPWPAESEIVDVEDDFAPDEEALNRFSGLHIDLFAAETAFALAEIRRLAGRRLPRLIRDRIRYEVFRRVLIPFAHGGPYAWETARHNWAAVCAGSVGAAALYLMRDDRRLSELLQRVLRSLEYFLDGYGEDGVCREGYNYWVYGFGFYTYFADLLLRHSEGRIDLFASEKVRKIAAFQQYAFLSGTYTVSFSDALPQTPVFLGLAHFLHRRFPDLVVPESGLGAPLFADHCGRWAPALRNIIWYDPKQQGIRWPEGTVYLPDAQWLVCRRAAEDGSGIYAFAAKGGHNDEPHNHNDVGSFILHADGRSFITDLGCGLYSAAYFGRERYTFLCNGSQGHSVPIVGGLFQRAGADARAAVRSVRTDGLNARLVLEAAAAYDAAACGLCEWVRTFDWRGAETPPRLVLEDGFMFDGRPADVVERFICSVLPEPCGDGRVALRGRTRDLVVSYDALRWEPVVTPLVHMDHFGNSDVCYALDFRQRSRSVTDAQAVFRLEFAFTA